MEKRELLRILRIGAILLCITTLTALLVGGVHLLTAPRIAENEAAAIRDAIAELFPDSDATPLPISEQDKGSGKLLALYRAEQNGTTVGYSAHVTAQGYGGEVAFLIGIAPDCRVTGIRVLSHSETPGIGSKVLDRSNLDRLQGTSAAEDVDVISGATYSSAALRAGIEAALAAVKGVTA